jgi:hypothetical protein
MNAIVSTAHSRWAALAHAALDWTVRLSLLAAAILGTGAAVAGVGLKHLCIF